MRKILFLSALTLAGMLAMPRASAQAVVVGSNFEQETFPPSGWTLLDRDNDGRGWLRFSGSPNYITQFSGKANAVSFGMDCETYSSYPAQDNWMILPPVKITNGKFVLSCNYSAQDLNHTEQLEVLVSDAGTNPEDFTTLIKETADNGYEDDVRNNSLSRALSAYEGKTVYIAFRHVTNGYDSYALSVDNVYVYNNVGPKLPSGFSVSADTENPLEARLKWTSPSQAADGSALADVMINIYRDGVRIASVEGTPGQEQTYLDSSAGAGTHAYTVSACNAEGETLALSAKSVFLGYDVPEPVKEPMALFADGKITLVWGAPEKGANKGTIDKNAILYRITRVIDGTPSVVADNVKDTEWTDKSPVAGKSNIYVVQALNESGVSAIADYTAAWASVAGEGDFAVAQTVNRDNTLVRLPVDITSQYNVGQTIYYPADFNFAKGSIKGLVYKIFRGTDTEVSLPMEIYMHETEASDMANGWDKNFTADNRVFSGVIPLLQGARDYNITLDVPYDYKGGNLVITVVKTDKPNANYSDRFYSVDLGGELRSYTGNTYDPVDIADLPSFNTWSEKKVSEVPSTRFIMDVRGVTSLSGIVSSEGKGTPVEGARISIAGYPIETETDADGRYSIDYVPVDAVSLTVTRAGFADLEIALSLEDGEPSLLDISLVENANHTLSGSAICSDTKLPVEGAVVRLTGYDNISTVADAEGKWTLGPVYSGEDYTLRIEYPLYDVYTEDVNITEPTSLPEIILARAPIAPFALEAVPASDGSSVALSWSGPLDRDVETGWNNMTNQMGTLGFGGDTYYSPDDFNVAHYFPASEIAERKLAGTVVSEIKVYLKATSGEFIAKVWEGVRNDNTELGAQPAAEGAVTSEGGWVTFKFDTPVEIRADKDYLIGLQCLKASQDPVGTNSKYNSGYDNIKWDDAGQIYSNAWDGWLIDANFTVPGTTLPVMANAAAPACEYNVYRVDDEGIMTKVSGAPVQDTEFVDEGWTSLLSGTYRYAVTAQYRDNVSVPALSCKLERSSDIDVAVTEIVSPVKQVEMQRSAVVKVMISNFGEKPVADIPVVVTLNGEEVVRGTYAGTILKGESVEFEVGEIDLAEGVHEIAVATVLEGDQVVQNDKCVMLLSNMANISLYGYRWNAYGNAGFMSIESNNAEGSVFLSEVTPGDALITAAEYVEDTLYGFTATWYGAPREFVKVKHGVWTVESAVENTDFYVMDMAYDYSTSTMYALTPDGEEMRLGVVDITEGIVEVKVPLARRLMTLACSVDGILYGISDNGDFCTVNPETGAVTAIGHTGVDGTVQYVQSMAFDHNSNRLFWVHVGSHSDGTLYEIEPSSGKATRLGDVLYSGEEASEIVALHSVYHYDPVSVSQTGTADLDARAADNGKLIISAHADADVSVWNMTGLNVATATVKAGRTVLDLGLDAGVYMVDIVSADGRRLTVKLIAK